MSRSPTDINKGTLEKQCNIGHLQIGITHHVVCPRPLLGIQHVAVDVQPAACKK
jgi:hypothetical protein